MHRATQLLRVAAFVVMAVLLAGNAAPSLAQSGASPYRYTTPPGWAHAVEGDIESLTPQAEPAGSAQLMLLAPKPANGDFRAQFESERAALESFWGLRAPQAVPLQAGQAAVGQYAAYFASYDSDGGPRYMGFLALGNQKQVALLVFVAGSDDAFNRLAPQAVAVFKTLSFAAP